jgi:hypothetical protein
MQINKLMALVLVSGCVDAELDPLDDVELGETTHAITDWMVHWYSANFDQGHQLDLGPANDKTCFLIGVKGSLKGWSSWGNTNFKTARAEVDIDPIDNRWKVRTAFGFGNGVAAKVACVSNTANREFIGVSFDGEGMHSGVIDNTSRRRCFINSIHAGPRSSPSNRTRHRGSASWSRRTSFP